MPRDGSGIYTTPAGTTAVPDTTIESAKYNANVADVAADLNAVRPIVAGGTGANNATAARTNLKAEVAGVQVTNYDSHAWENGSFYSVSGATGAPNGTDYFLGICTMLDLGLIALYARNLTTHIVYTRSKVGGVGNPWSAWTASGSGSFVLKAGDTMTGNLTINGSGGLNINGGGFGVASVDPTLYLQKAADANAAQMYVQSGGISRWLWRYADASSNNVHLYRCNAAGAIVDVPLAISWATGDMTLSSNLAINKDAPVLALNRTATTGPKIIGQNAGSTRWTMHLGFGNANSDFFIDRHDDAGTASGTPLQISRATGTATFSGQIVGLNGLSVTGAISATGQVSAGYTSFTPTAPDGASLKASGGFGGGLTLVDGAAYGSMWMQSGSLMLGNGGSTNVGSDPLILDASHRVALGVGFFGRNGTAGTVDGYVLNFRWTSAVMEAWVGSTFVGNMTLTSDYRIKKDVTDLPSTWDVVKALRPIKYTQAQYTSDVELAARKEAAAKRVEQGLTDDKLTPPLGPTFTEDDIERWGFVAHEVQETLLPSAASAVKDDPVAVQSLNLAPIVASLTKALQEAMTRIEALEAAAAVPVR